ncbi:MAG: hydroxymethylpyrimidine/phosphomethylpyrimidine kinase [Flavobacteriales bacterium]|nr:hydroxymethylpyrimidine/phosphomethylpyrimidine kinase [Flavobacteriales bacterium]
MTKRKNILSIAGFDPSGGAGILADVKTFEQHKVQGFGVITANTIQTDSEFDSVNWIANDLVLKQLSKILNHYPIQGVKIGLVPSGKFLERITDFIIETQKNVHNERPLIVWDPVLSASAGFDFEQDFSDLKKTMKGIDYVTPNWNEIEQLTGKPGLEGAKVIADHTKVYLKGGHSKELAKDFLVTPENVYPFNPKQLGTEKHGSGCIHSSALVSNLVNGRSPIQACLRAKRYVENRLQSNGSLLTYHSS